MKKASLLIAALLFVAMLVPTMSNADDKKFDITASSKIEENSVLLKIKFKDAVPQSGVCPYMVKSLSYDTDKKDLSLEVLKGFCVNEQFGQSQGVSYWVVPKTLMGSKLCITINQSKVGFLVIEENKRNYRIYECE